MFRDFTRAFAELFTQRRGRLEVSGLLLTMAMLPVSELLVTRMFSHLILHGSDRFETDPRGVAVSASTFFVAFALSRALHHVVRLNRVRVFRRAFDASDETRPASREAWSWAAAFELSTAMVALIQITAFCGLFFWIDLGFGAANLAVAGGALGLIALIYGRQLQHQVAYLAGGGPAIGERVGRRVRDAEFGAVVASLAMALSLGFVLLRALQGAIPGADAIVLFIGLRMMFSQVGNLSASAMRFARVKARLGVGAGTGVADPDPDSDFDDFADETEEAAELPEAPSPHRIQAVTRMVLAGQRGEAAEVERLATQLNTVRPLSPDEQSAHLAGDAFAAYARSGDGGPLALMWWARPFPGTIGNWLSPFLLSRHSGRPVLFQRPTAASDDPHLILLGSIAGSASSGSVVAGTGALHPHAALDPRATYLSVRGPHTAALLHRAGGPALEALGDLAVLTSRLLPLDRTPGSGRLAFVRHRSHQDVPVVLTARFDELDVLASHPDRITSFVRSLVGYDGVVTSDPGVLALCHSYGLPAAPVAFTPESDLAFVLDDYARGLGLGATPTLVDPDLGRTRWDDLLATETVSPAVLDDLQATLDRAVSAYLDRAVIA